MSDLFWQNLLIHIFFDSSFLFLAHIHINKQILFVLMLKCDYIMDYELASLQISVLKPYPHVELGYWRLLVLENWTFILEWLALW